MSTRAARRGEDRGNSVPFPVACTSVAPTYSWPSVSAPAWHKQARAGGQAKEKKGGGASRRERGILCSSPDHASWRPKVSMSTQAHAYHAACMPYGLSTCIYVYILTCLDICMPINACVSRCLHVEQACRRTCPQGEAVVQQVPQQPHLRVQQLGTARPEHTLGNLLRVQTNATEGARTLSSEHNRLNSQDALLTLKVQTSDLLSLFLCRPSQWLCLSHHIVTFN